MRNIEGGSRGETVGRDNFDWSGSCSGIEVQESGVVGGCIEAGRGDIDHASCQSERAAVVVGPVTSRAFPEVRTAAPPAVMLIALPCVKAEAITFKAVPVVRAVPEMF